MRFKILLIGSLLAAGCVAAVLWRHWRVPAMAAARAPDDDDAAAAAPSNVVQLPEQKLGSLDIRVEPAGRRSLQETHVVPGRIQYDGTRRVEVPAAASGILTEVRVNPGDRVAAEQVLAVISSPEVGLARLEVHHAHHEIELTERKRDWEIETSQNLSALIDAINSRVPLDDLEHSFKDKTLGRSRQALFTAYARYLLADDLWRDSRKSSADVLPQVTIQERRAERYSTAAALTAACEQARFDTSIRRRVAETDCGEAVRRFNIATQQVRTLLGHADPVPIDTTAGDVLSQFEVRAPLGGTVEEKRYAQGSRVEKPGILFVVADTRNLWVAADLREQDWRALSIAPGSQLMVEAPSLPEQSRKARVRYVGRQMAAQSNSVPLIAEISNADGLLRPGMFVRVSVPAGTPERVLCVPVTAVVANEDARFVFVQENPRSFRRVNVKTGAQTDGWVEIVGGLTEGTPVVVQGATALKSELLIGTISKED